MSELDQAEIFREVVCDFNKVYYHLAPQTWHQTRWMGVTIYKTPTDLWVCQEIVHETRPTLIIETGTAHGGSALFFAHLGEHIGGLRVVSIEIKPMPGLPQHPAIAYLTGSSTDAGIFDAVRALLRPDDRVMVILDSDHAQAHVAAELAMYAPLVTAGCYLIVEDTNINGHPVTSLDTPGPGPWEAVTEFLPRHPEFEAERSREKFMLTFNPRGYLRRKLQT
jgi:cephalosporin hydroxylase